jgi:hypothetical protein
LIEATILQLSRRLPHSISNLEMLSTPPDENQTAERTGFPIGGIDVLTLGRGHRPVVMEVSGALELSL